METIPFWKKIHQTVSGYSRSISNRIVNEILTLSKTTLVEGLLYYKPFSKKQFDQWIEKSNPAGDLKEFMYDLCQDLNLDVNLAYPIMCNYLMFEYYGKIKEFWQITRIGTTAHLKENIWTFYSSERMFLLKTWRHILECAKNNSDFTSQYNSFLNSIKLEEFQENLIKQFKLLLTEINRNNFNERSLHMKHWVCRNVREQIEILLILLLTTEHNLFSVSQVTELIKLFTQNNFGTQSLLPECRKLANEQDMKQLMCVQTACFFVLIHSYWNKNLETFWEQASTKDTDTLLVTLGLNPSHSTITLFWLLLKFKTSQDEHIPAKIGELFQHKPFVSLNSIISNKIFKNCGVDEIVLKAVHGILDELCLLFDDRKLLYIEDGIFEVLSELLRNLDIANIVTQTRNGLDVLVDLAIQAFPMDFRPLTLICRSLLTHSEHSKTILQLLNNLPTFLSNMPWTASNDKISVLTSSQRAFHNSDLIVFPANTLVRSYAICNDYYVQYRASYSYFKYLEHAVSLLSNGRLNEDILKIVVSGYEVVIEAIKCSGDMDLRLVGLETVIQKLNNVLFLTDGPFIKLDLIKLYLDVWYTLLVHRRANVLEINPEFIFPKLKPDFTDKDLKSLLLNQDVFESTIFTRMFHEEEFKHDHKLMVTYLDILSHVIKTKDQSRHVHISAIVYLLNFIFLHHQTWHYDDDNQKAQITCSCLTILHNILQANVEDLSDKDKRIYELCEYALLNNVYIAETFLRLFIRNKYHLILTMEQESNWLHVDSLYKMKSIRMQLALLLILTNPKIAKEECLLQSKLQIIVKPVASYFTNSYNPVISELSCRFLEKLSQIDHFPLLALLELDHYQVQSLFLERLRDPLEEEMVKIAIIDLINTCIVNQNGMTAAFFNLKCFMYWDGGDNNVFTGDNVSEFMLDYLQNVRRSHEYFKNPLQLGILRLLYNLWHNHRENLIDGIATMKDFWSVMMAPFFCEFTQDEEVYTYILKVVNLEIMSEPEKVDPTLLKVTDDFFKTVPLKPWCQFVSGTIHGEGKQSELARAWMEFIILTKKVTPASFSDEVKLVLVESCLDGLNHPEAGFGNVEIVYLWSKLYLILTSEWLVYKKSDREIIDKLTIVLRSVTAFYKYLPTKAKEIILCIIHKTVVDFVYYFEESTVSFERLLCSLGEIIDMEYEIFTKGVCTTDDENTQIQKIKPWLLIIFTGNSILRHYNAEETALWFSYVELLERVMHSVGIMVQQKATLPYVKLAIDFMITYSESPLVKDFLRVDMFSFYYKIDPPIVTINVVEAILSGVPATLKEWWLILIILIKLIRSLMDHLKDKDMLNACFIFISQHDNMIQEMICLTKCTVDMTALTLVCETLKLIHEVLSRSPQWSALHPHSFSVILEGITTTINACVLSVLGYKKINFYNIIYDKPLEVMNEVPNELLVSVLNKLIEIIYWCSLCLKTTKPDLISQLNDDYSMENVVMLIRNDFSVPRFELPIRPTLSYGTLLCLADYLCKTLNQVSLNTPTPISKSYEVSMANLNVEIKSKSLTKIFEYCTVTYEKYIGFMVYMQRSEDLPNDKLSSFLHFDMSEFSGSATSITSRLDYRLVKSSLEALMTFLTAETFITVRSMKKNPLFAFKRELSSEIQFFYEFVRKRTGEQYNSLRLTPMSHVHTGSALVRRYMMAKFKEDAIMDVADNNFVLVLSQFLVNFCSLSN